MWLWANINMNLTSFFEITRFPQSNFLANIKTEILKAILFQRLSGHASVWWKHQAGFCTSQFCLSSATSSPVNFWEIWRGKISNSNGAVFFGMPLLMRVTTTATISRSPCQRLGKHFKGEPFESNWLCVSSVSEHVRVKVRVEELKIVFLRW